jgi:hypothetical protein
MKHVLHAGTGTFFAVSEAVIFDDEDLSWVDKFNLDNAGEVPESVTGVALSAIFEKLA